VDEGPPRGKDTAEQADYLEEIAASSAYAAVLSIVSAAVFVACVVFDKQVPAVLHHSTVLGHPTVLRVLTAVGLALLTHLALILLMVLRRIFALVQGRLVKVRTGRGGTGGNSGENVRQMAARRGAAS
jgi:hypothetical protein